MDAKYVVLSIHRRWRVPLLFPISHRFCGLDRDGERVLPAGGRARVQAPPGPGWAGLAGKREKKSAPRTERVKTSEAVVARARPPPSPFPKRERERAGKVWDFPDFWVYLEAQSVSCSREDSRGLGEEDHDTSVFAEASPTLARFRKGTKKINPGDSGHFGTK